MPDSGSAFHSLGEQDMSEREAESQFTTQSPETLQTANGVKDADQVAKIKNTGLEGV